MYDFTKVKPPIDGRYVVVYHDPSGIISNRTECFAQYTGHKEAFAEEVGAEGLDVLMWRELTAEERSWFED